MDYSDNNSADDVITRSTTPQCTSTYNTCTCQKGFIVFSTIANGGKICLALVSFFPKHIKEKETRMGHDKEYCVIFLCHMHLKGWND